MEDKLMEEVVQILIKKKKTISTMESCTGGGVANAITNIEGASEIFKFSAVTYSNEFKIKMGVSKETINKYSVYSIETAKEMSKKICEFTNSSYGVGITGKLNRVDKNNPFGEDNIVFISIYDQEKNEYFTTQVEIVESTRNKNKELVIANIKKILIGII